MMNLQTLWQNMANKRLEITAFDCNIQNYNTLFISPDKKDTKLEAINKIIFN